MKNDDKIIESSYLKHLDSNNLYRWAMSQRLPVTGFEWMEQLSEFDERFIKNNGENNDKGYILEVEYLLNLNCYLPFFSEGKKIEKCKKPVCNIHNKEKYVVDVRVLIRALNHGLILRKVHKVIQFSQKACLKPYIDMKTNLRTEAKNDLEKDLF